MSRMYHIPGRCESRNVAVKGDWCNAPVVEGSRYCPQCKCSVGDCPNGVGCSWPLLDPPVGLCSKHYKHPPEQYRALVAAANAPPDDFDIPC